MRNNPLGRTGLFVSELCLGAMTFGGKGFWEVIGNLGAKEVETETVGDIPAKTVVTHSGSAWSRDMLMERPGPLYYHFFYRNLRDTDLALADQVISRKAGRGPLLHGLVNQLRVPHHDAVPGLKIGASPGGPLAPRCRAAAAPRRSSSGCRAR